MTLVVEKVTAFISRSSSAGTELLLLEHPYAGIQIPAGTVEPGEEPADAALREAAEETGLEKLSIARYLGEREVQLPRGQAIIAQATTVYSRPAANSFDWARLPRGITVSVARRRPGCAQVTYRESDVWPNADHVTYQITGWVPEWTLASVRRRHFYQLACRQTTPARWTINSDNHEFTLFWTPIVALPTLVAPQDRWLEMFLPQSAARPAASGEMR
jgi:8-oxo-dGTP pyrophosphatase MutT (NUDIX family)